MKTDTKNALAGATDLEKSRGDASQDDLDRGYYNGAPEGNYEGGLRDNAEDGLNLPGYPRQGTRHAGYIQPDGFNATHGNEGEYGFLRRPSYKSDIEPN